MLWVDHIGHEKKQIQPNQQHEKKTRCISMHFGSIIKLICFPHKTHIHPVEVLLTASKWEKMCAIQMIHLLSSFASIPNADVILVRILIFIFFRTSLDYSHINSIFLITTSIKIDASK